MKLRIAIALTFGIVVGCDPSMEQAKPGDESQSRTTVDPIIPEDVINAWGYRTLSTANSAQSEWEAREFGPASIRTQDIKAINEVPDWENAYYRFTLVEELYEDEGAARSRNDRLKHHDPRLDSKLHPELILRTGFHTGNRVLYAMTDSMKFEIEAMPSVVASFGSHILGTPKGEQADATNGLPAASRKRDDN